MDVLKAVNRFTLGSSAGGIELHPNHLQELCKVQGVGNGTTSTTSLTRFVNLFLSRRVPPEISPWLCGAPLTSLKRRNGGIRPIAVGGTLLRLIRRCAMAHVSKSAAEWLRPIRIGIATPNGREAPVYSLQIFIEKANDGSRLGLLSLDLSNEFML